MFFMPPQVPTQLPVEQLTQRSGSIHPALARQLVGRHVKINRGGPDSIEGVLIAANGEVLVLDSKGTIIYVNGRHVKSITQGKSGGKSGGHSSGHSDGRSHGHSDGRSDGHSHGHSDGRSHGRSHGRSRAGIILSPSFLGVLAAMRQQFVQINRAGPEKLEGFLADIQRDIILLLVGREIVRVPVFHIKTVNFQRKSGGNKSNKSNQSNKSNKSNQSHKSNKNHKSNKSHKSHNRSNGNRSRSNFGIGGRR